MFCQDLNEHYYIKTYEHIPYIRKYMYTVSSSIVYVELRIFFADLTQHLNNIFQSNSITHVNTSLIHSITLTHVNTSLIDSITHLDTDLIEYTSAYGYQDRETTRFKILAQHKRSKHILTLTQLSATCLMCLSQLKSSKSLRTLHQ